MFDRLCLSLGTLGKFAPRPLIDSLMGWRKLKGDQADAAFRGSAGDLKLKEVLRERKSVGLLDFWRCQNINAEDATSTSFWQISSSAVSSTKSCKVTETGTPILSCLTILEAESRKWCLLRSAARTRECPLSTTPGL